VRREASPRSRNFLAAAGGRRWHPLLAGTEPRVVGPRRAQAERSVGADPDDIGSVIILAVRDAFFARQGLSQGRLGGQFNAIGSKNGTYRGRPGGRNHGRHGNARKWNSVNLRDSLSFLSTIRERRSDQAGAELASPQGGRNSSSCGIEGEDDVTKPKSLGPLVFPPCPPCPLW
jgi:hypothetical protein